MSACDTVWCAVNRNLSFAFENKSHCIAACRMRADGFTGIKSEKCHAGCWLLGKCQTDNFATFILNLVCH